jgi:cysteine synthase A
MLAQAALRFFMSTTTSTRTVAHADLRLSALRVADDITDLVGSTPMLRLKRLAHPGDADVYAKLEFLNPGGSVKDRAALGMILDAEKRGVLRPGMTILEATAGNTGVGLALIGVNRGYKVILFVPEGYAEEKCTLMRGFGATVIRTPEEEGMAGAIRQAKARMDATENAWPAFQFDNQANPDFHEKTTASEIWEQMEGEIDGFVAGVGTGGTFSGVARFLKKQDPTIHTMAVETQGSILQGGPPDRRELHPQNISSRSRRRNPNGERRRRLRDGAQVGGAGRTTGRIERRGHCSCGIYPCRKTRARQTHRYDHSRFRRALSFQRHSRSSSLMPPYSKPG